MKERQATVKSTWLKSLGGSKRGVEGNDELHVHGRSTASTRVRVEDAGRKTKNARRVALAGTASMCGCAALRV